MKVLFLSFLQTTARVLEIIKTLNSADIKRE